MNIWKIIYESSERAQIAEFKSEIIIKLIKHMLINYAN